MIRALLILLLLAPGAAFARCGGSGGVPFSCDATTGALGTSDLLLGGRSGATVQFTGAQILQMIEGNALHMGTNLLDGSNINFTGGAISGVAIAGAAGSFTSLGASGTTTLGVTNITNGAATLFVGGAVTAGSVDSPNVVASNGTTFTAVPGVQPTSNFAFYSGGNLAGTSDRVWDYSQIGVASDTLKSPGGSGGVTWFNIVGNVEAGFTGKRAAFAATINFDGTNGAVSDDSSRQWQAAIFTTTISANQGGTAPHSGTSAGFLYASADQMWCYSGATDLSGCIGHETDVGIWTGASAASRVGQQIITFGNLQGADIDMGLRFGATGSGGTTWAPGFMTVIGLQTQAVDASGAILQYQPTVGLAGAGDTDVPAKAALGIDLAAYNFSTAAFRAAGGFLVDGAGAVHTGSAKLSTSGATVSLDAPGSFVTAVTVSSGGSGYVVGDQLYDPNTGTIVTVATLSGSAVATLTLTHAGGVTGSTPSNPVTLQGGTGAGATVTLTWTAATTLSLNPSHGVVVVAGMPTSCSGHATGTLINNSGVVNVCP